MMAITRKFAPEGLKELESRVIAAAEATLAEKQVVSVIDVLVRVRWLPPGLVEDWRRGRVPYLEGAVNASLNKISTAMKMFGRWAQRRGLKPSETVYVAWTRDRHRLRFSKTGTESIERAYRTHWISPQLTQSKRERLEDRERQVPDILVISPLNDWSCTECGGTGGLLIMEGEGPLCLRCAEMDHLVFLPSGDAALTRRAKKASSLSAVVVRFSRARKRYERQGILVEEAALERAEEECLADEDVRARRRLRSEERRQEEDREFQADMAREILQLFPGCRLERADAIARHAGTRGSGRVGRTAAGRALAEDALTAAVVASVRHTDTAYDELLMSGIPRAEARDRVREAVEQVLERWRTPVTGRPLTPPASE